MKISIVTPSYNQGRFIEETIKSVIEQDFNDFEYIVMDGGSSDETIEILKKYNDSIKWFSKKDKGQSDAINQGLKLATGDIVAYINSDDFYLSGTFRKVANYFNNNPKAKILTGDYTIIDEFGNKNQRVVAQYKKLLRQFPSLNMLSFANFIIQPSTFWRRSLLEEIGYFNEDLHYVMDYEYWMRVLQKYDLHVLPDTLSVFRIHSLSKGGHQFEKQFEEELEIAGKYNKNKLIIGLHSLHNKLITTIYKIIK